MGQYAIDIRKARGESFVRSKHITGWRAALRTEMRKDAEARNARWRKLTPQQQIDDLDRRLGKNQGAVKQRARIIKMMEA